MVSDQFELSAYLDSIDVPDELDRPWLLDVCLTPLGITATTPVAEACEDIVLVLSGEVGGALQMRPGGWRVRLGSSMAKVLLSGAIVAAGLAAYGMDEIPLEVIPAVLPALVDVEHVRLDRRERALLVPLRLATAGLDGMPVNPQVVYDRLPTPVRDQLNYLDFLAFCDRLIAAGEMDDGGYEEIRPRRSGDPAWIRITFD